MFDELEEEPRVDLTPLIDVIFMLVIFFVMPMTHSFPTRRSSDLSFVYLADLAKVNREGRFVISTKAAPKN